MSHILRLFDHYFTDEETKAQAGRCVQGHLASEEKNQDLDLVCLHYLMLPKRESRSSEVESG